MFGNFYMTAHKNFFKIVLIKEILRRQGRLEFLYSQYDIIFFKLKKII